MGKKAEQHDSTIDPNLPSWIKQEAEFAGALGRAARRRSPIAIAAWVLIGITLIGIVIAWIAPLVH